MTATKQQYLATAKFHDRIAQAFAQNGRKKDSASAKKAAELARKSAETLA